MSSLSAQPAYKVTTVNGAILRMGKLSKKLSLLVKRLIYTHTGVKWQHWDLNPDVIAVYVRSTPGCTIFATTEHQFSRTENAGWHLTSPGDLARCPSQKWFRPCLLDGESESDGISAWGAQPTWANLLTPPAL